MSDAIIKMTGCVIRQQKETILKNVNLEIQNGEFIYLIGKVGSGKSSFLKTLYAELPLAYGNAEVAGFQLNKMKKTQIPLLRRKCGIVFQDFKLLIDRDIYKNLEFVLRATGWKNKKAIQERIETVLTKVGMLGKQHQMPHRLSGGEQQRIVLARALLNAPPLILADEPTGNIDPETSYQLIELLKEISDSGKTVIIATHQYDLIEKYPGRVFCCENGELIEQQLPTGNATNKAEPIAIVPPTEMTEQKQEESQKKPEKEEEPEKAEEPQKPEIDVEPEKEEELKKPEIDVEPEKEEVPPKPEIEEVPEIEEEIEAQESIEAIKESTTIENTEETKGEDKSPSLLGKLNYPEITAFDYELEEQQEDYMQNIAASSSESKQKTENEKDNNPPLVMDLELI